MLKAREVRAGKMAQWLEAGPLFLQSGSQHSDSFRAPTASLASRQCTQMNKPTETHVNMWFKNIFHSSETKPRGTQRSSSGFPLLSSLRLLPLPFTTTYVREEPIEGRNTQGVLHRAQPSRHRTRKEIPGDWWRRQPQAHTASSCQPPLGYHGLDCTPQKV